MHVFIVGSDVIRPAMNRGVSDIRSDDKQVRTNIQPYSLNSDPFYHRHASEILPIPPLCG